MRSKKLLICLVFLFVSLFAFGFNVKVNAIETSELIEVKGAQVRTTGNPGLRFVATETYEGEESYGILLAFGEAAADENFVVGGTVNGKEVGNAPVATAEEGVFMVTLWDIPEAMYTQKVSARAYVKVGENYVYSSTVTVRSLADVVEAAYEVGDESEFVQNVFEYIYKPVNVTFDVDGGYIPLYPSVDAAIADFLADYNACRNKSHTAETYYALGSWGEISDASLFLYNENYKAKWAWLVNYIAKVASNANKQAFETFFNYNSQAELNAANSNNIYRIAYELRGWVGQKQYTQNGNFMTADYSSAEVQAAYVSAVSQPTTYTYYKPCKLPIPVKANYVFLGWVDEQGNVVTDYPSYPGSSDVTAVKYTATWKASYATVSVTYDANGGALPMACDSNHKIISIYDNVGGANNTYFCDTSITSKNSLRWQYKVLLEYDETLNAYKVVCLDAAKASAANAASAAGVTWTHALANAGTNISTQYKVGQYIYIENNPVVGDKNISYVVLDSEEALQSYKLPTTYTISYVNATPLLTATKEGAKFIGWRSSVDGEIYTEFPSYSVATGITEITYTAVYEELE